MRLVVFFLSVGVAMIVAVVLAVLYTTRAGEVEVSLAGIIAMIVGIVVTFLVGGGLMFLVFLSGRRDPESDP